MCTCAPACLDDGAACMDETQNSVPAEPVSREWVQWVPLGGRWGDVLLGRCCWNGTRCAGVGKKREKSEIVLDVRRGELEWERERESAPLCCVLFISQTHHCTGWERAATEELRRGRSECTGVCAVSYVEMNDLWHNRLIFKSSEEGNAFCYCRLSSWLSFLQVCSTEGLCPPLHLLLIRLFHCLTLLSEALFVLCAKYIKLSE